MKPDHAEYNLCIKKAISLSHNHILDFHDSQPIIKKYNEAIDQCIKYRYARGTMVHTEFTIAEQLLADFSERTRKAIPTNDFDELTSLAVYGAGIFRLVMSIGIPSALATLADIETLLCKIMSLREIHDDIVCETHEEPLQRFISAVDWHLTTKDYIPYRTVIIGIKQTLTAIIYN